MASTLQNPATAQERLNDASPCGRSVRAEIRAHGAACDMRESAKDALKRTAKQEAAAGQVGISQSRLSHKIADGTLTLRDMEAFGPSYAAEYGRQLVEKFAVMTPKDRARATLRTISEKAEELRQLMEEMA